MDDAQNMAAVDGAFAVIEFSPDGAILRANANFLSASGFSEDEITGRHHRMFMPDGAAQSACYAKFWATLGRGEPVSGLFERRRKDGSPLWLEASYAPVKDRRGRVLSVIKVALDVTASQLVLGDAAAQLAAISRSQAVIEFKPCGEILTANENFLAGIGYAEAEIVGRHHRIFVDPEEARSPDYARLWRDLADGQPQQGQFRRITKSGKDIFIQATYTPILDARGKTVKVVKFATDITGRVTAQQLLRDRLGDLADGALDVAIAERPDPEFTVLFEAFNATVDRLREMVGAIRALSVKVSASADAIDDGATSLSSRSESQAASLEETSATMEQISVTAANSAGSARAARTTSEDAAERTAAAREAASAATEAMRSIRSVAGRIGEISGVITTIASQTNLLALNASVEAARAGEAGRGFAVVAAEVRDLAQRSGKAASDIAKLADESRGHIDRGVEVVERTGGALGLTSEAIREALAAFTEISQASTEQASGVTEVSASLRQLDTITQENAAMADRLSNDTRALQAQAAELNGLVAGFRESRQERSALAA
ncbi:methyl-accepting chemotaxis protein [Rubrimonas cliftonensis]|uniref:methyl-accepting chemotaxis protein n=1 Tax=Rubrimonas cliftonensis TaxID=89524 RepID=UPI001586FD9E|nr:PAS domain-containing methyl-accepting chemotaxis protein [Rubrimonas cliftonensis]